MKRGLSFLLAMTVVFCTLSSVTATVYADYDANLIAHQKMDNILQNYVDPSYYLDVDISSEDEKAVLKAIAEETTEDCKTEYEKISVITRLVAENIYYDYDYYEGRSDSTFIGSYAVWTNKRTICAGYAGLIMDLLGLIDIPCMCVGGDNHAYNVAYDCENKRWIYLDATWCSSNKYLYGEYNTGSYISSRFDMSLETLSKLSNHEFYGLNGIFLDGLEYRIQTPQTADTWANTDDWYALFRGVSDNYSFENFEMDEFIGDIPVTYIGSGAFENCTNLVSIKLPETIETIGPSAFQYCTNLKSITIPDNVMYIGTTAFYECTSLDSIVIPDNVTKIGYAAFQNCTNLGSVTFGDSIENIGEQAFSDCLSLVSITLPDSVMTIARGAFRDCSNLSTVSFGNNITSIGEYAFYDCNNLEYVFFSGSENMWDNITIDSNNTNLLWAKIHYNGTDHTYLTEWQVDKEATCEENGSKSHHCAWCDCKKDVTVIEKLGHDYSSEWTVDKVVTCTEEGSKSHHCSRCDSKSDATVIPALGHSYGNWVVLFEATCTDDGGKYKKCSSCNDLVYEDVFAEGHTTSEWITDKKASVIAAGKKHKECTECGEVLETAEIPQLKCSNPKLKEIENTTSGVKITWGKVSGADKYYVYRKTSGGSYSRIGSTKNTYYTDKTAKSGKKYYYIVKAINEAGSSSSSSSLSKYYLEDTTLKTPSSTKKGVVLKWSKVTGAEGYMVYRKTGSGSYSRIATVKGSTKVTYTDKSAKKGKKYTYKVKAYKSKTYSAYSNTKTITDKY